MTEEILLKYFQNVATAQELAADLKGSHKKTSHDTVTISVKPLDPSITFIITRHHLIHLCNDMLDGNLSSDDITTIAFAIICSESFSWDKDSEDESIIDKTLYDWDNPDIGYPLTFDNMKQWKNYLETGVYNLNEDQLK